MTTTPKRKRGQHAKRHPWSKAMPEPFNDYDCSRWGAFAAFRESDEGRRALNTTATAAIYDYFMAGYRAGKAAK